MAKVGRPINQEADADLLEALDMLRDDYGCCSLGMLAKQLGIGKNAVVRKVERLVRDGVLEHSSRPGSIRRKP